MMKRRNSTFICLVVLLFSLTTVRLSAQHNASWGRPPDGWDDFYLGLVNDYKNVNAVGETGYWLDVINKANGLSTYNVADPNKKSVLYQYKYINAGVDTSTNWHAQKSLVPYGMDLLPDMRYCADQVGMRNAWVIYMMQEDGGAIVARDNIANSAWLKKFFLNIKYVAQTGAGRKEIFILEPDTFGYIIQYLYNNGAAATGTFNGVGLSMTAPMSTIATDPEYSYLAGLSNDFKGVVQGMIRTIRKYNPEAYCGTTVSLWGAWTPQVITTPVPPKNGLVWWSAAQIDAAVTYQSAFYQGLLLGTNYDKGDFLVPEKNGYPAYLAVGGQTHWMWGDQQMQNYLSFFQKLGQAVCLPLVGWQISLGQSSNAAGFGITLSSPPAAPYVPLPNGSQGYEDTFMQYLFNNVSAFIDAGFIGILAGKGMPQGTDYSLQTGFGDKGFFFSKAQTVLDPGRPWNLYRGAASPNLGNDTTLCGTGGSLVLNPGNMGASTILWSTGASTPTITVASAGTYWVQVGSGSECTHRDTIVISNTFSVNLGSDQDLCTTGSIQLDAGHSGTNVTYVWKKDGVTLPLDESRYLTVSNPGTYLVEVTDPSCLPMKSDEIIISSSALTTNSGICVNFPSTATLTVSNTGGTYKWYSDPTTVGSPLFTGSSYTTPVLSGETTYYVADEAMYSSTIIPKIAANGFTNSPNNGNPESTTDNDWLYFDVLKDIQLVSLKTDAILYFSGGTQSATLIISNTTTGFSYSQLISYSTPVIGSGPTLTSATLTLPAPLTIPAGTGYKIRLDAAYSFAYYKGSVSTIVHPKTYNNLVKTTGYSCAVGCAIAGMPAIYDWNIKAASTCARTPVTVRACGTSLPVEFVFLNAQKEEMQNRITWLIENKESGVFELERSRDGISFGRLYTGISSSGNLYTAIDANPLEGISFYRVKQTDPDNAIMYSRIVSVTDNGFGLQVNVFPNPSNHSFQISVFKELETSKINLMIFNTSGQLIHEKTLSSYSCFSIGEDLPSGVYILKVRDEFTEYNVKLIKQ